MLTSWTLANFKSVKNKTTIKLAPLTVLCGANSSGKSTLLQSILMVGQSFRTPTTTGHLNLNGESVRLGSFKDVVYGKNIRSLITIGFSFNIEIKLDNKGWIKKHEIPTRLNKWTELKCDIDCLFRLRNSHDKSLSQNPTVSYSMINSLITDNQQRRLKAKTSASILTNTKSLFTDGLSEYSDKTIRKWAFYKTKSNRDDYQYNDLEDNRPDLWAASLHWFLPALFWLDINPVTHADTILFRTLVNTWVAPIQDPKLLETENAEFTKASTYSEGAKAIILKELEMVISRDTRKSGINTKRLLRNLSKDFSLNYLDKLKIKLNQDQRRQVVAGLNKRKKEYISTINKNIESEFEQVDVDPPDAITCSAKILELFFSDHIYYFGPIRVPPQASYLSSSPASDFYVGPQGENTAQILDEQDEKEIDFIDPKDLQESFALCKPKLVTLREAVSKWLEYLQAANSIDVRDLGQFGFGMDVKLNSETDFFSISHVGVGVSQVLPLIVGGLCAGKDSLLIFEQPELHLHPRVQSRLADFFLAMTLLGKQCIVETHSEYLINRLCYLSAAAPTTSVSDKVLIYFVTKQENQSEYEQLVLNEYGVIRNWPPGFFDESAETASLLIKAAAKKRMQGK
jgi:predicted ATPase